MQKKKLLKAFFMMIGFCLVFMTSEVSAQAKEPVIVVIDPGHGGENLGAEYDGYTEKKMTMVTARAMKEELEKYDGVVVYMTHEADVDMSLRERAEFAKEKQADFLFSLHYNASVKHNLFGSEVWVPAYGEYYVKGYQFAEIQMQEFENIGLYSRGIKTKLNDEGSDYYGILRQCTDLEVPSALIEHCHMDQDNDKPFYQQGEEQWKAFGRMDAEAVAKYFGLKSQEKSTDYSSYPKVSVTYRESAVMPDKTPPEVSKIEILKKDEINAKLTVSVKASDSDSYIQYFKYSFDGGITYSDLQKWPRPVWNQSEPENTFDVTVPFGREVDLRVCVYNGFDGWTESNCITLEPFSEQEKNETQEEVQNEYREITYEINEDEKETVHSKGTLVMLIFLISFIAIVMLALVFAVIKMLFLLKPRKKRQRMQ